ncbi:MAG: 3-methyl-2-oxobutanoate hydroxymethyltransferase [Candidatus Thiodiazotropha sp. (ex Lucina aurantia)]|uniref:3-methyl-2-oxobutanoate hydroxymethyltransferase n=1 Tax=Candidatus Thiodiazotropha taylori TaxID=2792791 RepID=A0A9E4MW67_9GAMM|nr:3-methyl-2-oxobutanoate hydroxymethyltransferase [Candidatus Thiodiazotropha taylori]MBT3030531.1 3-methyl-2-oxobutanoate hydroxymethyltransferase [Candidatus Thiodiazotropha sp. (ex Lucina pensylvanica)]MBT3038427.1 3-methyl-2-oxobutanoate hydroxymethyltransferase [Candidatus Thiodiazotropha sp. (ex Codakia orbicularis)]MBV2102882.1 3-methyl-2-oxobutanoate hydroxymethyltransferase [Candidatus Thiodiazotropha sp. (ex Lucina aurantia)]MCG7861357.1 3-methyl-2-oxobutanoate hydroxymethyltransfer
MSKKNITVRSLLEMKSAGEKICVLTSYDASFTRLIEDAGVEVILVGDSLGMVIQGQESTLPVTLDEMIYHTRNAARAREYSLLVADMPFMSYRSPSLAMESAGRLMKEGGAHMVKLEGGTPQLEAIRQLASQGIPVCGHLGLLPQSVHKLGGYRVQGREQRDASLIREDARLLQDAGVDMLVLECVPDQLAAQVATELSIPVIGIGAGPDCDGQVLVLYDMLGINPHPPRFVKNFLQSGRTIQEALKAYVDAVKSGDFPTAEHSFK